MDSEQIIPLEPGWQTIAESLNILQAALEDGFQSSGAIFSNNDYSRIYSLCWTMCTQRMPFNWSEELYVRHGESITTYLTNKVVPALQSLENEALLREFLRRRDNHTIMNRWYAKLFMYLNRYHVKFNQLAPLSEVGENLFASLILQQFQVKLSEAALHLVCDVREQGFSVDDEGVIKRCLEILVVADVSSFLSIFEAPFLAAIRQKYTHYARTLTQQPILIYLTLVERALDSERQRLEKLLSSDTLQRAFSAAAQAMLDVAFFDDDAAGCRALCSDPDQNSAELLRLCDALQRWHPRGLQALAAAFHRHVVAALQRTTVTSENKGTRSDAEHALNSPMVRLVKSFVEVQEEFLAFIKRHLQPQGLFQHALAEAFTKVLSQENTAEGRMAEAMALFCDRLLRKAATEKGQGQRISEIEACVDQTLLLFGYLGGKDVFADVYRRKLALRLLQQRSSASDDLEHELLMRLKRICGPHFTAPMESMLTDILAQDPKGCTANSESFSVHILSVGHWPQLPMYPQIVLPAAMRTYVKAFEAYYYDSENMAFRGKRKLIWVHSVGEVILQGHFQKTYGICATTLQAAVLLQFNSLHSTHTGDDSTDALLRRGVVSFTFLLETLQMPEDVLKKVLHSCCFSKKCALLKRVSSAEIDKLLGLTFVDNATCDVEKEEEGVLNGDSNKLVIRKTDWFQVNEAFRNDSRRFRMPTPLLEDSKATTAAKKKALDDQRGLAIEAAIVRIMKARKQLSHAQLIGDVLGQMAFFKPDPRDVKKHIESLIDREFLERDKESPSIYKYLAL
eukprot:gene28709-34657_t